MPRYCTAAPALKKVAERGGGGGGGGAPTYFFSDLKNHNGVGVLSSWT